MGQTQQIRVNKNKKIKKGIESLVLLLTLTLVIWNTAVFYKGFHNVDLVYNYARIETEISRLNKQIKDQTIYITPLSQAKDMGSDWILRDLQDYYIHGLNQMEYSYLAGLILMVIIGIIVGRR